MDAACGLLFAPRSDWLVLASAAPREALTRPRVNCFLGTGSAATSAHASSANPRVDALVIREHMILANRCTTRAASKAYGIEANIKPWYQMRVYCGCMLALVAVYRMNALFSAYSLASIICDFGDSGRELNEIVPSSSMVATSPAAGSKNVAPAC